MENMTDNYYEFIGVKRDASVDDIKRACNKLLQKYHPDHYSEVHAEGTTKYINKIKDTLCDPVHISNPCQYRTIIFDYWTFY